MGACVCTCVCVNVELSVWYNMTIHKKCKEFIRRIWHVRANQLKTMAATSGNESKATEGLLYGGYIWQ